MYKEYWGFKEFPFENTPDPRFLYLSPSHQEGLMRLNYGLTHHKGAIVLTGNYGTGKTVLSRAISRIIDSAQYHLVYFTNPQLSSLEFLIGIAHQLGADNIPSTKIEMIELIDNMLQRNLNINKHTVVIIDEAHLIDDRRVFEELRLLLNFQLNDKFLLTLILIGQSELRERVNAVNPLRQRIAIRYHLEPLSEQHTREYILHRVKVAMGEKDITYPPEADPRLTAVGQVPQAQGSNKKTASDIFPKETCQLIYRYSKGLPREINHICDLSLLDGYLKHETVIRPEIIESAARDLEIAYA
jgi:type II secretory pathway predicted ATPase ExeA